MKPNAVTCLLLIACVLNLLFGCSQRKVAPLPELEQAEAVMFEHPDSALHILQRMPKPADKEQHALWCLLVTQAECKQLLPVPSDSLIRIAYDYYKPTDDARRKAMAALYMGTVNYSLCNAKEAQAFYLEAAEEMKKTDDYKLGYLVMSGLGNLYLYRDLTDYALEACQKALDYAVKDSNKRYEMASSRLLARCYSLKKDFSKSIAFYMRAIDLADSLKRWHFCCATKAELANVYSGLKQYDRALFIEREVLKSGFVSEQLYYGIGMNYMKLHRYDSAYYYFNHALANSNVYTRRGVYRNLLRLSYHPKYQKYMISFNDSLRIYEDSIRSIDKSKEIILYQEQIKQEKLKLEKANASRWLLVSVLVGVVLLSVLLYFYQRRKIILHRKEEELNLLTLRLRENELLMERNRRYISELEAQAEESREAVEQLKEQKEQLAFLRQDNEALTAQVLAKEAWLSALRKKPVYLDEAGAKKVRMITDKVYTDFTRRLSSSIPMLSEYDLTLCCLVKLRFPVSDIAVLLGISSSSVSTSKLRAKKKIYETLGIADKKSLDQWIGEF